MSTTVPAQFLEISSRFPEQNAQYFRQGQGQGQGPFVARSYADLRKEVERAAGGFKAIGVKRGDKVALISENRPEWLISDYAILGIGAADVPRGVGAAAYELRYLISFSGCRVCLVENEALLAKILEGDSKPDTLETLIFFDPPGKDSLAQCKTLRIEAMSFDALCALGDERLRSRPGEYESEVNLCARDDIATLIYTSGTTGDPKGVMLTHGNFLHQTDKILGKIVGVKPGHIFMSVLPVWHSFERIAQYMILSGGAGIAYSKPIGSVMLADFGEVKPQYLPSVPRLWEGLRDGVYRKMRKESPIKLGIFTFFVAVGKAYAFCRDYVKGRMPRLSPMPKILPALLAFVPMILLAPLRGLGWLLVYRKLTHLFGGKFVAGISGGGALPPEVDTFFNAIGIKVLEGYGLTETAPVVSVRNEFEPVMHTIGKPLPGIEVRIVDEEGKELKAGNKGLLFIKGPTVMKGYWNRPDLTQAVLSEDGWLNTGDLAVLTYDGELKIMGRRKDTIVLLSGENIEPFPIEQKLCESPYIKQAMVVGQDKKFLAALIVPDQDAMNEWAIAHDIAGRDYSEMITHPKAIELIQGEIAHLVNKKHGFQPFERIFRFALLAKPFELNIELSAKQEIKRYVINEKYARSIDQMFR